MISNPEWLKLKIKPYLHQISMDCLEKLVECMESCEIGEIDTNACLELEKQILTDEIDGLVAQYKPSLNYKDF